MAPTRNIQAALCGNRCWNRFTITPLASVSIVTDFGVPRLPPITWFRGDGAKERVLQSRSWMGMMERLDRFGPFLL